jgi:3-oxoadipate enol-lactonase
MSEQNLGFMTQTASLDGPHGAPVLVLGNSLGTSRAVWDRQAAALGSRFRLLRFELPGHGGAPSPAGPYTIAQLGAAVLGLLDRYEVDLAAYCGISLGGMIGMWLAASAPERISALGLVCTSAHMPPASGWSDRIDLVRSAGMASVSAASISRWFTPAFTGREPAVIAAFTADLEHTEVEGYAGCCAAIGAMDLRGLLASITAPTLVIAGAEDPSTPPAHGAAIASAIPGARLQVIRGAAHLASVCAPAEVAHALLSHLRPAAGRAG